MDTNEQKQDDWKVVVVAAILMFMLVNMVVGRMVSRCLKKCSIRIDDYVLLLASVSYDGLRESASMTHVCQCLTFVLCAIAIECEGLPLENT